MQFTVLIEFLIPGLLTVITVLLLFFDGRLPDLANSLPGQDTTSVLLLLAISYPVGILVNFPLFQTIQELWITPRARARILTDFRSRGLDLVKVASHFYNLPFGEDDRKDLRHLWRSIRASAFSLNIERLSSNHLYHEGLQRFARGMLPPLVLGLILAGRHGGDLAPWLWLILLLVIWISWRLLKHSLEIEDEQIARFFLASPSMTESILAGRIPSVASLSSRSGDRITFDPKVAQGAACVRALRVPVSLVLTHLTAGKSAAEIIEEIPELEPEDIAECLRYAAWMASVTGRRV